MNLPSSSSPLLSPWQRLRLCPVPTPRLIALLAAFLLCAPSLSAPPDPLPQLDAALPAALDFSYGKDPQPLRTIEQSVLQAASNPGQREAVEQRLLAALQSPATRDAREFLCRQLFIVGTPRCIPPLEALLTDPELAHVARLVLGRLEYPEALAALHRALAKTAGPLQIGLLTTLGERRYQPALPDLTPLLAAPDPSIARAAAQALGHIGGPEATRALQQARLQAPALLAALLDDALLACADRFLAEGQPDLAGAIYRGFMAASQPEHLRIATLRGHIATAHTNALPLLLDAIQSADPGFAASAIAFSHSLPGPAATIALARLLPSLPYPSQELLVRALGERRDPAALPAVLATSRHEQAPVRLAAWEALGSLGDASVVPPLLAAAAGPRGPEAQAARASLTRLPAANVNDALLHAATHGDTPPRLEAIRALARRKASPAVDPLLHLAADPQAPVREAALRALGDLVSPAHLGALVSLLLQPTTPDDRATTEAALESAFRRIPDPHQQTAPILTAWPSAHPEARPALLRLLGRTGTPAALETVRTALRDDSPAVREAALRTLADWPNPAPAGDLLALSASVPEPNLKILALRGYIRLAGLSSDPTALYARAMNQAQRPEDQRMILGGLGTAQTPEALALVEQYLANPDLHQEAALAAIQIADRLRSRDPAKARAALERILQETSQPAVRAQTLDALDRVDPYRDHILAWTLTGPYHQTGQNAAALFAHPFPPEPPNTSSTPWRKPTRGVGSWNIDLDQAIGAGDDRAAYARTRVWTPSAIDARLDLGSDDGIKVWLNGHVVHAHYTERGCAPKQDTVKVRLQEGWNVLLLKIVNRAGGWGFACRLRQADGSPLPDLRIEPE